MNNSVLSSAGQCVGVGELKERQNFDNRHSWEMGTWEFIIPFLLLFVAFDNFPNKVR